MWTPTPDFFNAGETAPSGRAASRLAVDDGTCLEPEAAAVAHRWCERTWHHLGPDLQAHATVNEPEALEGV